MNFNSPTFLRWALAALKRDFERELDPSESLDIDAGANVEIQELNAIAGGDYWQSIATSDKPFPTKINEFVEGYRARLKTLFGEVCAYPIKQKWKHKVPKYHLIFASRHPDALLLMNDATAKAKIVFQKAEFGESLFDDLPVEQARDLSDLKTDILSFLHMSQTRRRLVEALARKWFSEYTQSELRKVIGLLIQEGKIKTSTGKTKINDSVVLSLR